MTPSEHIRSIIKQYGTTAVCNEIAAVAAEEAQRMNREWGYEVSGPCLAECLLSFLLAIGGATNPSRPRGD